MGIWVVGALRGDVSEALMSQTPTVRTPMPLGGSRPSSFSCNPVICTGAHTHSPAGQSGLTLHHHTP